MNLRLLHFSQPNSLHSNSSSYKTAGIDTWGYKYIGPIQHTICYVWQLIFKSSYNITGILFYHT